MQVIPIKILHWYEKYARIFGCDKLSTHFLNVILLVRVLQHVFSSDKTKRVFNVSGGIQ
jgi:hypothetical protein